MAFLIFERTKDNILRPTGKRFSLAGYNLIYKAWKEKGHPLNKGWHVTAGELVEIHFKGQHSYDTRRLIIDFDPEAKWRIALIELLDVYAYTYGENSDNVYWTPLMLRLRRVLYEEKEINKEQKTKKLEKGIKEPSDQDDIYEFLYLKGSNKGGWNWGPTGMTNGVLIDSDARSYFRNYF